MNRFSRLRRVRGRMREFLGWHIIWHYVPNVLALAFIACYIVRDADADA